MGLAKQNDYAAPLGDLKNRIRESQARSMLAVNAELFRLFQKAASGI